mgnify:CR=1 FL=1|jgi:hypothetical protein
MNTSKTLITIRNADMKKTLNVKLTVQTESKQYQLFTHDPKSKLVDLLECEYYQATRSAIVFVFSVVNYVI